MNGVGVLGGRGFVGFARMVFGDVWFGWPTRRLINMFLGICLDVMD